MTKVNEAKKEVEDHECHDRCGCNLKVEDHEVTHDHDLPQAKGGVMERKDGANG